MNSTKLYPINADDHALPFTSNMKYTASYAILSLRYLLPCMKLNSLVGRN